MREWCEVSSPRDALMPDYFQNHQSPHHDRQRKSEARKAEVIDSSARCQRKRPEQETNRQKQRPLERQSDFELRLAARAFEPEGMRLFRTYPEGNVSTAPRTVCRRMRDYLQWFKWQRRLIRINVAHKTSIVEHEGYGQDAVVASQAAEVTSGTSSDGGLRAVGSRHDETCSRLPCDLRRA